MDSLPCVAFPQVVYGLIHPTLFIHSKDDMDLGLCITLEDKTVQHRQVKKVVLGHKDVVAVVEMMKVKVCVAFTLSCDVV